MNKKQWFFLTVGVVCLLGMSRPAAAGTLAEISAAVDAHYTAGAISSADIKNTLSVIVAEATASTDAVAKSAYRQSLIDIVNAFNGAGITSAAASDLISKAQE